MTVSDWTVLFLFDGHGEMQSAVDRSLRQLESVGSTDSVQLVAQVACGEPYYGSYTAHLQKSKWLGFWPTSRPLEPPASTDPSDPNCLTESIVKTMKAFPSRHFMVVLGGHGGAFKGLLPNTSKRTILALTGLKSALDTAAAATGRSIDVLLMDSCLGGCAETAYAVKDAVRYLAASEEVVLDDNLRYDVLVRGLKGAGLDQAVEASLTARRNGRLTTASVIDCARMDELVERMRPLARKVTTVSCSQAQHFRQPAVLKRLSNPGPRSTPLSQMRDLVSLARAAGETDLADFVQKKVVVCHAHGRGQGLDDSHGLSIYAPEGAPVEEYRQDLFAQAAGWLSPKRPGPAPSARAGGVFPDVSQHAYIRASMGAS